MSTIYLIRHGLTEANLRHLYCGSTDLPLSQPGIAALEALKPQYRIPSACRFVTSGLLRTEQTLSLLFGDVPHDAVPDLREMDFGIFEMGSYDSLKDTEAYQAWLRGDNEENVAPGGESGSQMRARVLSAFKDIAAEDADTVIVTHGGVISAIMQHLFPGERKNRYAWQPTPGRGYAITGKTFVSIP